MSSLNNDEKSSTGVYRQIFIYRDAESGFIVDSPQLFVDNRPRNLPLCLFLKAFDVNHRSST